jgi:hypothetical protein
MIYISNELYHHGVKGMRWGVRKQVTSSSSSKAKSPKLSDAQKTNIKKGAKIAGKILVGAAATYAVVKIPNTKTYAKGVSKVSELLIKPVPGTKYLMRQAILADRINTATDYAAKAAAVGMAGTTAYKANKKYKVVRRQ